MPPEVVKEAAAELEERYGTPLTDIGEIREAPAWLRGAPTEPSGRSPRADGITLPPETGEPAVRAAAAGAHDRRVGFGRRRGHPGGPEDVRRARRVGDERRSRRSPSRTPVASPECPTCRPTTVAAQIRAVADDIGLDAAKTGMLSTAPIVEAVAEAIEAGGVPNVVVDPVFLSKHGHSLLGEDAVAALRRRSCLLRRSSRRTSPRRAGWSGSTSTAADEMRKAADEILAMGAGAVLVKGGHLPGDRADDYFTDGERSEWLEGARIDTPHTHGTGCVLSAAIAAYLARGAGSRGSGRAGEGVRHRGDPPRGGHRRRDRPGRPGLALAETPV